MEMHRLLHAFRYGENASWRIGEAGSGSLSLTVSLEPSCWFAGLAAVSHVGHLSFCMCPDLWPTADDTGHSIVQGKSHKLACLPADTDSREVGVLPQQLLNHINYAASNLPTSFKHTMFETHGLALRGVLTQAPHCATNSAFIWVRGCRQVED